MIPTKRALAGLALSLGALWGFGGCATLMPQYVKPGLPVADNWPSGPAYKGTAGHSGPAVAEIRWQEFFTDPRLRQLISLALDNNRDLKMAAINIEKSRALYQIQRSDLLPKVEASAASNLQRVPADFESSHQPATIQQDTLGVGISSYELDFFGRVRSLKAQALDQYLATVEARRAAQLSLVSQIAYAYLNLAADRERLRLAQETLSNQQAAFKLVTSRCQAGIASDLDLEQAQTSVDAARLDIARYTTLTAQDENALNLVAGTKVPAELLPSSLAETLTALKDLSPGLPSEVLLSRPDILQAEELLKGANANIGAARAAFFPRITLVSAAGLGSTNLSGLFSSDSFAWSLTPKLSLPIFDAGANRAGLEVSEADKKLAVARYEKAIQTAFREVADALAQRGTIDEQLAAQQSLADASAKSYQLSQARYGKGVDSYLSVLVSQRALYAAQQNLINVRLARLLNLSALYQVLGGGSV